MHIGACGTQTGPAIIGAPIIGCAIGVPMASGAPSTAGAAIAVPHGEPL
jgi:hypothetical protein